MNTAGNYKLSGVAQPVDVGSMLDQMCEHFLEHAEVRRSGDTALLKSEEGVASLRVEQGRILIELDCPSEQALQMSRTSIAEHMFYFAGDEPFDLKWSGTQRTVPVSNLHYVTVVSAEDVTPLMRRVRFSCDDVAPFIGGDMHVRLMVPPAGRTPVWPSIRDDGRIGWPKGDDALLVRAYTIRAVDVERGELLVDFVQHPAPGVSTPGADFARDAKPGMKAAFMGPGSGHLPDASSIFLAGDESALPAIARIIAEVPAGTRLQALIEVADPAEEQPLPTKGTLDLRWLHRSAYPAGEKGSFAEAIKTQLAAIDEATFVWVACEKEDVRAARAFLRSRGRDRRRMYVAWYWEREPGSHDEE
ncbi:DUF2218 domain-containing protein [Mesorhizobium sp. CAU 1741]|uniref:DUF2218 domain-containing protein n=1 Tax=Mesorhizobium sp. CAU 1741 TaxID=3140366 RepID=UPI00325A48EE